MTITTNEELLKTAAAEAVSKTMPPQEPSDEEGINEAYQNLLKAQDTLLKKLKVDDTKRKFLAWVSLVIVEGVGLAVGMVLAAKIANLVFALTSWAFFSWVIYIVLLLGAVIAACLAGEWVFNWVKSGEASKDIAATKDAITETATGLWTGIKGFFKSDDTVKAAA